MSFERVDALTDFPALERRILELWKERKVFERSLEETRGRPEFVFYEGPPTANGLPHNGHVLTRVMKDLFPRYRTMRGYHVERRAGWDTHGLPVEVEVEKELRIRGKEAILAYGVEPFVRRCIDSVFRYTREWEDVTSRLGFWVDLEKAYVTFHKSYVESVWWALARLFEKGLLYKGHKVVWWWAQGGTALSSGETGNAYRTVDDPSVYVRFPLLSEAASLVVWTTTPWTLPSNMFAAVHGELEYVYARDTASNELLVLAEGLLGELSKKLGRDLVVEKKVRGDQLIGKRYEPPFDTYERLHEDPRYFRVVPGDRSTNGPPQWFVTLDAGTGVVHVAPAFGEDDWKVWKNQGRDHAEIEMLCAVRPDGGFSEVMGDLEGTWVKDADKILIRRLGERGLLLHAETYRHEYPFCWRSENDPLIQYAREAWFIRTTKVIDDVIEDNQRVNWLPEHVRDGRFGDFLANNVDWALSRERFWGTPLNIWQCSGCQAMEAPSSCAEIEGKNPHAFDHFAEAKRKDPSLSEHLAVHKPWIDEVTWPCAKCGGPMRRVPEVIDCWFDSGCMPFAQFGYPHAPGSVELFKRAFPADFISEAIDQTRGWFYSLIMISNLLFPDAKDPHPFKRCIVLGHVCDKSGKKESKSSGNYTPPELILDRVRMTFGPVEKDGVLAASGEILIAREDLEGLDVEEGAKVTVTGPNGSAMLTLRAHKKLTRRVAVMDPGDRAALGLELAPSDLRPAEVIGLPKSQQVTIAPDGAHAPGADAFRWFFYASNPPWNNTRHSLANVRGLQKELPLKLRAVYSFFVTYANIDGFDPARDEPKRRPVQERSVLDRWALSELERTKRTVVERMDEFASFEAAQALSSFVEGLSNWYVRRSRQRFWGSEHTQDKLDAYWTLYQCLRDVAIFVAPFLPFAAEDMYQNLIVRPFGSGPPDSVHLRSYPMVDLSLVDEELSRTMGEVRELASQGLKVRTDNKLRVRQPLAAVEIVLSDREREGALRPFAGVMADELNVKAVNFVANADDYVTYKVKPNFKALGKRLGARMKATQDAIAKADPSVLKAALDSAGTVALEVGTETITLGPDELLISVEAKEGFSAAGSAVGVVILDTRLDDALIAEGLYREVLNRVQTLRKEGNLDYQARIKLAISGAAAPVAACRARESELAKEVLAAEVVFDGSFGSEKRSFEIDGHAIELELVDLGAGSAKPRKT
ncbi:MAG: isoleucine--tRNA ligase [Deltaproteobacteria bacterium]|nr:isoleucine--tRNA ligase [Deltaproteobacteria bacterium]